MSEAIRASNPARVANLGRAPADRGPGRPCARCPHPLNRYNPGDLCGACSLELQRATDALSREYAYTFLGPNSFKGAAAEEIAVDFAHRALLRLAGPTEDGQEAPRYAGGAALLHQATGMSFNRASKLLKILQRRGLIERCGTGKAPSGSDVLVVLPPNGATPRRDPLPARPSTSGSRS